MRAVIALTDRTFAQYEQEKQLIEKLQEALRSCSYADHYQELVHGVDRPREEGRKRDNSYDVRRRVQWLG